MKYTKYLLWFLSIFGISDIPAQVDIEWQKCLGGTLSEGGNCIQATPDGGYIVAGFTMSDNGDVKCNRNIGGFADMWLVKLTSAGGIQWQKCLGSDASESPASILLTPGGGYIVVGEAAYMDHRDGDVWIVKLTSAGDIQWQKYLGGTNKDGANVIYPTPDGGYIIAGETNSNDGDVSGLHSDLVSTLGVMTSDAWVVKLTSTGEIEWQKCIGGIFQDGAQSIRPTSDGGYIVAGVTYSNHPNETGDDWDYDMLVVKLSATG